MAARRYALVLNLFVFLRVEGQGREGAAANGLEVGGGGEGADEMRNVTRVTWARDFFFNQI